MRMLLSTVLLLTAAAAQGSPVVAALEAGEVKRALDMLEAGSVPDDVDERLQVVRLLADVPRTDPLHERALGRAALILPEQAPPAAQDRLRSLAARVGETLTAVLITHTDVLDEGRIRDRTHLGAGLAAHQALRLGERTESPEMLALGLHLAPLLLAGERPRDAATVAADAATASPTPKQLAALHAVLAQAKLQLGRADEALPFVRSVAQTDPGNAEVVLPLAKALPPRMADAAFALFRDVVRQEPRDEARPAWAESLACFYAAAEKLADRPSSEATVADLTVRMSLPQTWHRVLWGEGYRIWLDPDARPTKIASGKDALILPVPQSAGWRKRNQPPADLARWQNAAYCVERGDGGPTLVVYWFGPNLEYWYGDTPVERGVTAKTVRGHSAGAIARMVFDIVYGEDAKRRQLEFEPHPALPFAPAERGHRRTFKLGDTIYDENVFSHGSVTIEVLLRVAESDLALLEPELRWMYQNLRKE